MLFNYRYVPHSIETLHSWLEHVVKQVWCRNGGAYTLDLLLPELKAVIVELGNDDSVVIDHLDGPIKMIDALCRGLTNAQRQQLSAWFDHNNDIEALCGNDSTKPPATYADIAAFCPKLEEPLKAFCQNLFTRVIKLSAVTSRIGKLEAHYIEFVTSNNQDKCPYCGLSNIMGQYESHRDAYDHYLPKGTYPFNSVNFRNLAPMCHTCNSSYKLKADPLFRSNPRTRRKAFYSYSSTPPAISISVTLNTNDIAQLQPLEIDLQLDSPGREEEVEGWAEIFRIEERYKARCRGMNDGKYWIMQVLDECANAKTSAEEILKKVNRNAEASPWAEVNFLKKPFLEACHQAGLV